MHVSVSKYSSLRVQALNLENDVIESVIYVYHHYF